VSARQKIALLELAIEVNGGQLAMRPQNDVARDQDH
jgi:hypothetical protein